MAIHTDFSCFTAEVVVDGKALAEYEDTDLKGGPREMIRYVEANPDSKFAIRWFFNKPIKAKRAMAVTVYVDGVFAYSSIVTTLELRSPAKKAPRMVDHLEKGKGYRWFKQELRFSTLEITDDTAISTTDVSMDSIRKIGDITVEVKSGSRGRRHKARSSDTRAAHHSTSRVSEKLLKGSVKSLRTSFGSDQSIAAPPFRSFTTSIEDPIYLITFKYRTKADLQALLILPRTPSPTPAIQADPVQTLVQASESSTELGPQHRLVDRSRHPSASVVTPAPPEVDIAGGLRAEEIIAMIAVYRGGSDGLAGQSKKSLLGLLKFYEDKDKKATPIQLESAPEGKGGVRIKRERECSASVGEARKRSKPEIIVLDD